MAADKPLKLCFAGFELDEGNARLSRDGQPVPLQPRALALLCELARQPGRLLSKDALLDAVWGHRHVGESALKTSISALRQSLGDDPRQPRFIETAARLGYRFIAGDGRAHGPAPVGRQSDLLALRRAWRSSAEKHRLVWVVGEAGIGKTHLIEAFTAECSDGLHVQGQCIEHFGGGEPYLPWLELLTELCQRDERASTLLRAVAPMWLLQLPWLCREDERETLRQDSAGASPERMWRELGELLARYCRERPLLLVLEDLHWCDSASLRLLDYLARRRGLRRLMLLCSLRPAEPTHAAQGLRHDLNLRGLSEEIALQPFSLTQLGDYLSRHHTALAARSDLVHLLYRRTEGLPLFVASLAGELATAPQESAWRVPEGLEGVLQRRVERLSGEQRALLEAASVCGVEFRVGVLAQVLGCDEGAVQASCQTLAAAHAWLAGLGVALADGALDGRFAFRHALYRQLFYQRLDGVRRAHLHRAVAAALLRQGPVAAAELAGHFEQGQDLPAALRQLAIAAAAALERFAAAPALQFVRHGLFLLETLESGDAELELDLLLKGGVASAQLHGMASTEASEFYQRAQDLAADLADSAELGWGLAGLAQVRYGRGEYQLARALSERVALLAQRLCEPALEIAACNLGGMVCAVLGEHERGRCLLERGIELGEALGERLPRQRFFVDPQVAMLAHLALHLLPLGLFEQAEARSEAALTRARALGQPMSLAVATRCAGMLDLQLGRGEGATLRAAVLARLYARHGLQQADGAGRILSGWAMAQGGDGRGGHARIREGGAILQRLGMLAGYVQVLGFAAEALLVAADWSGASALLAEAEALAERLGERARLPELGLLRARVELGRGDAQAAQVALRQALAEARAQQAPGSELKLLLALCRLPQPAAADCTALRALCRALPPSATAPLLCDALALTER